MSDPSYPEHDKLADMQPQVDALIDFIEDWAPQKKIELCHLQDSGRRRGFESEVVMEYMPVFGTRNLIYEFLNIDQDQIEVERRAMLDDLRKKPKA